MRRASLAFLISISGCAFDPGTYSEGEDPGNGYGTGSGSGSADPDQDTDGDGELDIADNCVAVGNVDQRDHDDDGRGDACDSCPHILDDGIDADGDGIANACDPNPMKAGDRVAFFEGFYGMPTWTNTLGANTWQLDLGTIRQADLGDQHQLVRDDNPNLRSVFIDLRVRINALSADASSRRSMGIVAAYRDDEHYLFCGLAAQGQGSEVNTGQVDTNFWGTPEYVYNASPFAAPMTGDWLSVQARTVKIDSDTTRIECSTHRNGLPQPTHAVYDADVSIDGDVGIRTNGADASFDYVFVVEMPTP